jgi:hypothetical protein
MKISYGLTVCNEHEELLNLITYLKNRIDLEDEIVVVYDQNRVTNEVINILEQYKNDIFSYPFNFQQNFLENKNFMNSKCTGDYIFQIDADEIPEEILVQNLKTVLEDNPVDLIITPRKNLVPGLTQEHIQKWGWKLNENNWVNYPDYQHRIYKNIPSIKWENKVHEIIAGAKYISLLDMGFDLIHPKTIERQEKQNNFYNTL